MVMIKQLEEYATCELGYFPDITPEHRIIYQEIRPTANYFCLGTEYLEWLDNNIITRRRVINFACSEDQLANPDTGIGDNYFQQSQSTQHMVYCPRVLLVGASNELVVFELYRRVHLDSKN
ncbi:hypothetical protein H4S01_002736 [Coemansia sp. RSA 2610]|nr:hypothetical protein H4S01_002736 [Coemansia sp. RSA 2610]